MLQLRSGGVNEAAVGDGGADGEKPKLRLCSSWALVRVSQSIKFGKVNRYKTVTAVKDRAVQWCMH